jgi:7-cyano-7-deazaguanine synthase
MKNGLWGLKNGKVCVLLSGGLDSSVLVAALAEKGQEVHPVYVRSGLVWEEVELHWVRQFLSALRSGAIKPLKEMSLPLEDIYHSHWSTVGDHVPDYLSDDREMYLPGRNLILLVKTCIYCALNQLRVVALGLLKGNPFPDSSIEFFAKFQQIVRQALTFDVNIVTPLFDLSKSEVIQMGRHLPLHLTFSCIRPIDHHHCGACNKCAERRRSFALAGIEDKTKYHSLPTLSDPSQPPRKGT